MCIRAAGLDDLWLCRACELREPGRPEPQCCLCPVAGGALKPTSLRVRTPAAQPALAAAATAEQLMGKGTAVVLPGPGAEGGGGPEAGTDEPEVQLWVHSTCSAWIPELRFGDTRRCVWAGLGWARLHEKDAGARQEARKGHGGTREM